LQHGQQAIVWQRQQRKCLICCGLLSFTCHPVNTQARRQQQLLSGSYSDCCNVGSASCERWQKWIAAVDSTSSGWLTLNDVHVSSFALDTSGHINDEKQVMLQVTGHDLVGLLFNRRPDDQPTNDRPTNRRARSCGYTRPSLAVQTKCLPHFDMVRLIFLGSYLWLVHLARACKSGGKWCAVGCISPWIAACICVTGRPP
jgi:hypothetical protein